MKANEIQIGDWLYYKGQFNAFHFKVESITKKKVGYHAEPNEHRMYYLRLSECKPIAIVPEILEKNGFEHGRLNVSPQYYLEDNDVLIGVTLKDIPYKHKGIDISTGKLYFQYDISHTEEFIYVHQLQHALRLCGIEKEIIL